MGRRSRLLWALGVLLARLICLHATHARLEVSFTPVNWSLVSSAAVAAAQKTLVAPIGCTCVQTRYAPFGPQAL
jgi:hypothetical protein